MSKMGSVVVVMVVVLAKKIIMRIMLMAVAIVSMVKGVMFKMMTTIITLFCEDRYSGRATTIRIELALSAC